MAHIQGTDYVGSMVVLEDGLPNKREYRRFKIKEVEGNDDYAAMAEVVRRRLQAYLDERDKPVNERGDKPGKFAYPPQLLLVDGGKGQLSAAKRVIDELELTDEIPVAGLAKRFEEVFIPDYEETIAYVAETLEEMDREEMYLRKRRSGRAVSRSTRRAYPADRSLEGRMSGRLP